MSGLGWPGIIKLNLINHFFIFQGIRYAHSTQQLSAIVFGVICSVTYGFVGFLECNDLIYLQVLPFAQKGGYSHFCISLIVFRMFN